MFRVGDIFQRYNLPSYVLLVYEQRLDYFYMSIRKRFPVGTDAESSGARLRRELSPSLIFFFSLRALRKRESVSQCGVRVRVRA